MEGWECGMRSASAFAVLATADRECGVGIWERGERREGSEFKVPK
jgi:hypothetical protein